MQSTKNNRITIESWIRTWQEENKPFVKESTFATYSVTIENHILPYFGKRTLETISHEDNQEFILFLSRKTRKDGTGYLSEKAVKDIMALWLGILGKAEQKGYINLGKVRYQYPAPDNVQNRLGRQRENYLTLNEEKANLFEKFRGNAGIVDRDEYWRNLCPPLGMYRYSKRAGSYK